MMNVQTQDRKPVQIAEEIHRRLKILAAQRGQTMKEVLDEYLTILLKGDHETKNLLQ